jgi:hypothetical protein
MLPRLPFSGNPLKIYEESGDLITIYQFSYKDLIMTLMILISSNLVSGCRKYQLLKAIFTRITINQLKLP